MAESHVLPEGVATRALGDKSKCPIRTKDPPAGFFWLWVLS